MRLFVTRGGVAPSGGMDGWTDGWMDREMPLLSASSRLVPPGLLLCSAPPGDPGGLYQGQGESPLQEEGGCPGGPLLVIPSCLLACHVYILAAPYPRGAWSGWRVCMA